MTSVLRDILLGSNKNATTGWTAATGSMYDVKLDDYGSGTWSVGCNLERIDAGTIGWIVRSDGNWGHIAGILAVTGEPYEQRERRAILTYAPGIVFPLPREWWVDGARLHLDGWPRRAPFGISASGRRMARFKGGELLSRDAVRLIEKRRHPIVTDWVTRARQP